MFSGAPSIAMTGPSSRPMARNFLAMSRAMIAPMQYPPIMIGPSG
jgi:hypothetical protein